MIFTVIKILLNIKTYEDVAWVGDGSDDSGGNHELLPGLSEVDDVDALVVALEHVWVHQAGAVLSADLDFSSEHKSDILLLSLGISELLTETHYVFVWGIRNI